MLEKLDSIIQKLDFQTKEKKQAQKKAWKNILEKSMMSKREANTILGSLGKIDDKLR